MAEKKSAIPTVAFDPAKHVISGRETSEGRQLFFTLGSLAAAAKEIEVLPPAPVPAAPPLPPEVTKGDLEQLEQRVMAAARAASPPPQFPAEIMATLTDASAAIVSLKKQVQALTTHVAKLEGDVAIHTSNFAVLKEITGASP